MSRRFPLSVFSFLVGIFFASMAFADTALPMPQTEGGMGLFEALKKRSSAHGGDFSPAEIKLEDLSTVLWSATGLNRGQKGWTVPMVRGLPPYCRIYVAGSDGVWWYDWASHSLKEVSRQNIKARIGAQSFVKRAYYVLIIVSDGQALASLKNAEQARAFSHVAAGAMSQNIYLAAAALKLGTRYIHSINHDVIRKELALSSEDEPIALMLLGK